MVEKEKKVVEEVKDTKEKPEVVETKEDTKNEVVEEKKEEKPVEEKPPVVKEKPVEVDAISSMKDNNISELATNLTQLNELKEKGILTEEEFTEQKKKLLKLPVYLLSILQAAYKWVVHWKGKPIVVIP